MILMISLHYATMSMSMLRLLMLSLLRIKRSNSE